MELSPHGPWCREDGPHTDVVMSCRARMARNVAGFPFVSRASASQQAELLALTRQVLLGANIADGMFWVDLHEATDRDRRLLVERHLISKQLAQADNQRGVAISGDESLSVMVNEEDHLRMQVLGPGLRLRDVFERTNAIDDAIEQHLDYAFSSRWGYLTACPTNVGCGVRFSVMMHLPALKITNQIERIRRAARDLHLAVRGYYGEGSDSAGDFYQVSNQVTLGRTEMEILEEFESLVLPRMIEYEQQARQILLRKDQARLDDRVYRALGILKAARLLGAEEAMKLLSRVRLGAHLERISVPDLSALNRLFLEVQPAHLQMRVDDRLSADQMREVRASLVRQTLEGAE